MSNKRCCVYQLFIMLVMNKNDKGKQKTYTYIRINTIDLNMYSQKNSYFNTAVNPNCKETF